MGGGCQPLMNPYKTPESALPAMPGAPPVDAAVMDSARRKAYWRLLPLLFISYMVAYVDRQNVAVAKLTMALDYPAFDDAVIGFGAGIFFIGYFFWRCPEPFWWNAGARGNGSPASCSPGGSWPRSRPS